MLSLLHKLENTGGKAAFVRRSANCFEDGVKRKKNHLLGSSISNQMIINLNVLAPLIKHRILGNVDC